MTRILIVDDNTENLQVLREILEVHGHGVMTAAHGAEALEKAGEALPDMIITDVLMPVMDGFTLCKQCKQDEVLKTVPLIFYSGDYIGPEDEKFGLSLGAERFIIKPTDPGQFIRTIENIIEEYHNRRAPLMQGNNREEAVYLKEYNEALIRRLEDKMREIERVNRSLEDRIAEYERVEDALRESEEKYRALFEHSPYSIILVDGETSELAEFNTRAHEALGYTREEFKQLKISDFEVFESEAEVKKHVRAVINNGYDVFETKHRKKDGEIRNILVNCSAVTLGGRKFSQSIMADVTERKKAARRLKKSEKQYRDLINYSLVGIFKTDLKGHVLFVNTALSNLLAYDSPEEMMSAPIIERYKNRSERDRLISILKEHSSVDNFEIELVKKNGDDLVVLLSAILEGDIISGMIMDITERKRAEDAMWHIAEGVSASVGEQYFYSLVQHLSATLKSDYAYIAEIDIDNPGRVRTLALMGDGKFLDNMEVELAGTPCDTVSRKIVASYPSGVQTLFPQAHTMAALHVEGYIGTKLTDSSGKWLGLIAVMYRDPIKNVKMVESILKIFAVRAAAEIERRRSEEALRQATIEIDKWNKTLEQRVKEKTDELIKSQAQLIQSEKLSVMGQMAAGLAHELNSPLAGLLPLIERYKEKADKSSRDYQELSMMLKASRHMAKVVRDFGTFSRESKGEMQVISINEVIDDTLVFSGVNLKKKRIEIIKEYNWDIPNVKADKTELQQVVLNMITNAGDAMRDGGHLTIRTRASEDKRKIMMEFSDCGAGIKKEHFGKIFEPFFTTKKMGEGIGLGLSVSYGIIRNHGGEISVESEHGKGTTFTISLPAVNAGDTI